MSKQSRYRVRKHRAIQIARKEEIEQIEKITAGSYYLQDDTSSSIKNKNGNFLLINY